MSDPCFLHARAAHPRRHPAFDRGVRTHTHTYAHARWPKAPPAKGGAFSRPSPLSALLSSLAPFSLPTYLWRGGRRCSTQFAQHPPALPAGALVCRASCYPNVSLLTTPLCTFLLWCVLRLCVCCLTRSKLDIPSLFTARGAHSVGPSIAICRIDENSRML